MLYKIKLFSTIHKFSTLKPIANLTFAVLTQKLILVICFPVNYVKLNLMLCATISFLFLSRKLIPFLHSKATTDLTFAVFLSKLNTR